MWVALRVPDGYVHTHANQARIRHFLPCSNPDECMSAPDVVSFAIKRGYWKGAVDDPAFSFSDVYDPVTFEGARFCEARVWSVFSAALSTRTNPQPMAMHLDYAQGYNLTNRMPLFVRPAAKLAVNDTMELMRTHFENTW